MAHETSIPYIGSDNVLFYLDKFASKLRQRHTTINNYVDMLIVGGAAIALKHDLRRTVDIDADIRFSGAISDVIKGVAQEYGITSDWLNQDFMKSFSYSIRLWENKLYLATLQGYLRVFVVSDLDQLCMKVVAGRDKDLNDAEGLVLACKEKGLTLEDYKERFLYLYGNNVRPHRLAGKRVERKFKSLKGGMSNERL